MKKSPLATVKERFETKEKLVGAVQELANEQLWLSRVNEVKGLERVSNAKLLRLHRVLTQVKERFGSRANLVDAILSLEKRTKDVGYKARIEGYPLPRLLDMQQSAERASKRAASRPAASAKKKVARSRKAKVKAAAAA